MCNHYFLPIADEELYLCIGAMVRKNLHYAYREDLAGLGSCRTEQRIHQEVISYEGYSLFCWSNFC